MDTSLPFDISAEAGVICTLILRPDFILCSEHLKPSHFYDKANGVFYWAIQELVKRGVDTIDSLTLTTQINTNKGCARTIGTNLEGKICSIISQSERMARDTIEDYTLLVNQVIALGFKRAMYTELKKIENKCLNVDNDDIDELNREIMDTVNDLAVNFITKDKIDMFGKKVDSIWESIKSKRNKDGTYGIKPAWDILSKYFTYQDGELILYCARRKHGKSVIAMNECFHKAKSGLNVVYFDTEMQDELFFTRLASHASQIDEDKIKSGNLTQEEETIFNEVKEYIKSLPIIHEYNPRWTKEQVVTQARILHNRGMCDFFIYDYIKDTSGKNTSSSEQYNELGNWCDTIKNQVLGALKIPGISFAQLNRNMQIGDSDKIERYVTAGVTWCRKTQEEIARDGEQCGNYKMKVNFNRIGDSHDEDDEQDHLDFLFVGSALTIKECKNQHEKSPFDE